MLSPTLLVALAGAASADMMLPRRVQDLAAPGLAVKARDTVTATNEAESKCFSAMAFWTEAPSAPFNYMDYQGCSGLPSSLTAAASSYQKIAASWWDAHTSQMSVARSLCDGVASVSEITSAWPTCTYTGSDLAKPGTGPTTAPSAGQTIGSSSTGTSSSGPPPTGTSNSTSAPTGTAADANTGKNTGHRETGLAWAAVAIAGLLGAVALL